VKGAEVSRNEHVKGAEMNFNIEGPMYPCNDATPLPSPRVKGFECIAPGAYYDSEAGLLIFDLLPRNAVLTEDGNVYPIDPVIQRIDAEFAAFLRAQPYTINLI
jgi:hypothetical protein